MDAEQWSDWLPVNEAAKTLGVSVSTLKRRLRMGLPVVRPDETRVQVQGEMIERPQGHEWRVRLPADLPPLRTDQPAADSKEKPAVTADPNGVQAVTEALKTIGGLVGDIRALERENGTLRAERDAARQAVAAAEARAEQLAAEFSRPSSRRWWQRLWWRE